MTSGKCAWLPNRWEKLVNDEKLIDKSLCNLRIQAENLEHTSVWIHWATPFRYSYVYDFRMTQMMWQGRILWLKQRSMAHTFSITGYFQVTAMSSRREGIAPEFEYLRL
jgi:hypothetical protein